MQTPHPREPRYRTTIKPRYAHAALPLAVYCYAGRQYLTVQSLSEHFGPSVEMVRRQLRASGLAELSVRLANKVGFPPATWAALKLAIVDRIAAEASPQQLNEAQQYMDHHVWQWARRLERLNSVN